MYRSIFSNVGVSAAHKRVTLGYLRNSVFCDILRYVHFSPFNFSSCTFVASSICDRKKQVSATRQVGLQLQRRLLFGLSNPAIPFRVAALFVRRPGVGFLSTHFFPRRRDRDFTYTAIHYYFRGSDSKENCNFRNRNFSLS